jgi:hypothetical protein
MIEVIWENDNLPHSETIAMWDEHPYYSPVNPGRVPTEREIAECPKVFVCFCCLEKHSQRELGGRYRDRWFCKYCIPYIDDWTAGAMVWWDERLRKPHFGNAPKTLKPSTVAERESQIRSAVVWCIMNGYPVKNEYAEGGENYDRYR